MANKTIGELPDASALTGTELLHLVQGGNSRKVAASTLLAKAVPPMGHLYGLTLSNNATDATNDIDVSAGECASQQSPPVLITHAGATGRQLDVAYGTGSGARFDSAISDGTWHAFVITNGTVLGFGFSKSLDPTGQANYPSGFTHYRRIGSIIRASSSIVTFSQHGDEFLRTSAPSQDVNVSNPGTSALTHTLAVPVGFKVVAIVNLVAISGSSNQDGRLSISALDQADISGSNYTFNAGSLGVNSSQAAQRFQIRTNSSGQIRTRHASSDGGTQLNIGTAGWIDLRGK
jgi:hypothetical protein